MNVKLVVVQGKPEGKEIPLRTAKFLIGRGPECHLRPNSELVSRNHSLFTLQGDELRVRDLGSTNGTLINGKRIDSEVVVKGGDLIQVGPLGFKVVMDEVAAPAVAPAPVVKPAAAAAAVPVTGKLGDRDAKESEIEQWLLSDSKHEVPTRGSDVYTGDTAMLNKSELQRPQEHETQTDLKTADSVADEPKEPQDKVVEGEGGIKLKLAGGKQKIEKTREDTSQAAADILRRMMGRRPGK